jgi:hypothetical protein
MQIERRLVFYSVRVGMEASCDWLGVARIGDVAEQLSNEMLRERN